MTLDENLATPAISSKHSAAIKRHIETIRKKYTEKGLNTEVKRGGEVLLVTLPTDSLFVPNGEELLPQAYSLLNYFKQAINHPESYRIVVAVHTDDTGDKQYSYAITQRRAEVILNFFNRIVDEDIVTPNIDYYWLGRDDFKVPNNTMKNRSANRRVEIYIVPEAHIIKATNSNH